VRRLLVWVFALIVVAGSSGPAAAEILTARAFTEAVAQAARSSMPSTKVTVTGDLEYVLKYANGASATSNLTNAYADYKRDPRSLNTLIHAQIAALLEAGGDADGLPKIERSLIVPVIRNRQWVEDMERRGREKAPSLAPLAEPLNSELFVVYAEDRPGILRILSTRDDVGDRTKLHDLAVANLSILLPKIQMRTGADGVFLVSAGGDFEASLLVIDSLWTGGQIKVDGDIVAAVPAKDALLVTGSNNHAGIVRMRAVAADVAAGPYGLTSSLFVRRSGKWMTFDAR
jgi:uncharacterized protein YtpQ (UPF0354 family)